MANGITIKHLYDRSMLRIEIEIDQDNIQKSSEMTIHINPKAPQARMRIVRIRGHYVRSETVGAS